MGCCAHWHILLSTSMPRVSVLAWVEKWGRQNGFRIDGIGSGMNIYVPHSIHSWRTTWMRWWGYGLSRYYQPYYAALVRVKVNTTDVTVLIAIVILMRVIVALVIELRAFASALFPLYSRRSYHLSLGNAFCVQWRVYTPYIIHSRCVVRPFFYPLFVLSSLFCSLFELPFLSLWWTVKWCIVLMWRCDAECWWPPITQSF
jgi:hypothetical protein